MVEWHQILFKINIISKQLQKEDLNTAKAVELISTMKEDFEKIRTKKGFEEVLVDSWEIAETIETKASFLTESQVCPKRVNYEFHYETADESTSDPKRTFIVKFYFCLLGRCCLFISAINSFGRFSQLSGYNDVFDFIYNIKNEDKNTWL